MNKFVFALIVCIGAASASAATITDLSLTGHANYTVDPRGIDPSDSLTPISFFHTVTPATAAAPVLGQIYSISGTFSDPAHFTTPVGPLNLTGSASISTSIVLAADGFNYSASGMFPGGGPITNPSVMTTTTFTLDLQDPVVLHAALGGTGRSVQTFAILQGGSTLYSARTDWFTSTVFGLDVTTGGSTQVLNTTSVDVPLQPGAYTLSLAYDAAPPGGALNNTGTTAVTIPEPATLGAMAVVGIVALRRRR